MKREQRLARTQDRGYLIASPHDELCVVYRVRCLRQQRPCVLVSVRKGYAQGQLDLETTRNRLDGPCATLSEAGARIIREFCAVAALRAKLLGVHAGSHLVIISRVPADEVDALGATLVAAARIVTSSPSGDSDGLSGSVATTVARSSPGGAEP
jgi:nucleotide-binding universal stress UspA family protein